MAGYYDLYSVDLVRWKRDKVMPRDNEKEQKSHHHRL